MSRATQAVRWERIDCVVVKDTLISDDVVPAGYLIDLQKKVFFVHLNPIGPASAGLTVSYNDKNDARDDETGAEDSPHGDLLHLPQEYRGQDQRHERADGHERRN